MKKFFVIGSMALLTGFTSFAQTNSAPSSDAVRHEEKGAMKLRAAHPAALVPASVLQSKEMATFHRIKKEGLLTRDLPRKNYSATLLEIFPSRNDLAGETCIRDTIITIFPPGR